MEGVAKKIRVVLVIFLTVSLSGAEGGRDLSTKGDQEVYIPQAFRFRHFPWWWWGIHNSETGPKDKTKGETMHMEVPKIGGMAGYGYLPEVDGMVSTKGEEVYNPQAFWFPHIPWWHFPGWGVGIHKTELEHKDMAKGETMNPEVPNVNGMVGRGYFPELDGMLSTKGEDVFNPQAFWFPHFPWWHFPGWGAGIHKTEIAPKDMAKGKTINPEVPKIDGMAGHGYLPNVDGMAGHGYP